MNASKFGTACLFGVVLAFTSVVSAKDGVRPGPVDELMDGAEICPGCLVMAIDPTSDAGEGSTIVRGANRGGLGLLQTSFTPTYASGQLCSSLNHPPAVNNGYTTVLQGTFLAQDTAAEVVITGEGRINRFTGDNATPPIGTGGISMRALLFPDSTPYVPNAMPANVRIADRWVMSQVVRDSQIVQNASGVPISNIGHNAMITPITVYKLVDLVPGVTYRLVLEVNFSSRNTAMQFDDRNDPIAGNPGRRRGAMFCHPQIIVSQYASP